VKAGKQNKRGTPGSAPDRAFWEIAAGCAFAVAGLYLMGTASLDAANPRIGDIVQFGGVAAEGGTEAYRHQAGADLILPGEARGAGCQMDSDAMARSGGSLLLYGTDRESGFRVHWSGGKTSAAQDCGPDADLRVSASDAASFFAIGVKLGRLPPPPG